MATLTRHYRPHRELYDLATQFEAFNPVTMPPHDLSNSSREEVICAICREILTANAVQHTGSEGPKHPFHSDCINSWLQEQDNCPICRVKICSPKKKQDIERQKQTVEWIAKKIKQFAIPLILMIGFIFLMHFLGKPQLIQSTLTRSYTINETAVCDSEHNCLDFHK